jgi:hypothetical protein
MWREVTFVSVLQGFRHVRSVDFDFYSLFGCASAGPTCATGRLLVILLHSITLSVAILKHFKQPSGPGEHLLFLGIGSPFLVDREGKPKDNISVSANSVGFGREGGPIFHSAPSLSRRAFR